MKPIKLQTIESCLEIFHECESITERVWDRLSRDKGCSELLNQWRWELLSKQMLLRDTHHINRPVWVKETSSAELKKYQLIMAIQSIDYGISTRKNELSKSYGLASHFKFERHADLVGYIGCSDLQSVWNGVSRKMSHLFDILGKLCQNMTTIYVRKLARYSRDEIHQCVMIGVMESARTYHTSLKYDFITHLYAYIEKVVKRMHATDNRLVKLPVKIFYEYAKITQFSKDVMLRQSRPASEQEILDFFPRLEKDDVRDFFNHPLVPVHHSGWGCEETHNQAWHRTHEDSVVDNDQNVMIDRIMSNLDELPPINREVISKLFGINCDAISVNKVCKELSMRRDEVNTIKDQSLKILYAKLKPT